MKKKKQTGEGSEGCDLNNDQIIDLCCRWSDNEGIACHYSFEALLDGYEWCTWPSLEARKQAWERNRDFLVGLAMVHQTDDDIVTIGFCTRPLGFWEYDFQQLTGKSLAHTYLTPETQERLLREHDLFLPNELKEMAIAVEKLSPERGALVGEIDDEEDE